MMILNYTYIIFNNNTIKDRYTKRHFLKFLFITCRTLNTILLKFIRIIMIKSDNIITYRYRFNIKHEY